MMRKKKGVELEGNFKIPSLLPVLVALTPENQGHVWDVAAVGVGERVAWANPSFAEIGCPRQLGPCEGTRSRPRAEVHYSTQTPPTPRRKQST
jgi:hypothetical protein